MLRKFVFGLLLAGGILSFLEGAMRIFLPEDALLYSWERADGNLVATETRLLPKPGDWGVRHDGQYPWRAYVNSETLREDNEVSSKRSPGEKRILALGDSWIFGISVTQGKTISDQLEDRLEAAGWAEHVDVINAGVPSFSAFDMLWRWQTLADKYEIDGVLLGQPHNSRISAYAQDRATWYHASQVSTPSDLRIYRLLRRGFDQFRRPRYAVPPSGAAADLETADMLVLTQDARARGLPVYVLLLPANMEQHGQIQEPVMGTALRNTGAVVGGHALPDPSCWGQVDHGHPSEKGASVLADLATRLVIEGKSLPGMAMTRCGQ